MATQQVVPVSCPNCRFQFTAPVQSIIDGQDPAQKSALLQGGINIAQCPQCGFTDVLSAPILYYDLEKELAFVFAPNDLQLSGAGQEKVIGNLTNTLTNSLPAEQRKFYLLNPKPFLSLDNMVKAILEADGITEEMLETQAAKVKLIEEFLQISDKAALQEKVKAHDAELDRDFFEVLTASIQATQMAGDFNGSQALLGLRTLLARLSTQGKQAVAEIDAEMEAVFIQSQDELLDKLQAAKDDDEFDQLIAAGHPMLDYSFFQKLTARIDEAEKVKDKQTAAGLTALRSKILDVKAQQEQVIQEAVKKSSELLREVIQSGQPDKVLAKKLDQIDQTFFVVLSANIEEAQRQKQEQAVRALTVIGNMAMGMLQERQAREMKQTPEPVAEPKIEIAR
jgi:hypothetical protein